MTVTLTACSFTFTVRNDHEGAFLPESAGKSINMVFMGEL